MDITAQEFVNEIDWNNLQQQLGDLEVRFTQTSDDLFSDMTLFGHKEGLGNVETSVERGQVILTAAQLEILSRYRNLRRKVYLKHIEQC